MEELREQQSQLRERLAARDTEVATYVNQISELRNTLDLQSRQQEAQTARIEELESQIVEVQIKKGEAEKTAKQLQNQLFKNQANYKQEKNKLDAKLSHLTANTKQLEAAVKQKTQTASQFAKTANLLRKDMNKMEVNRPGQNARPKEVESKQEIVDLKKKLTQQLEQNKSLNERLESLKVAHQEMQHLAKNRGQEIESISGETRKLKQELQDLSKSHSAPQGNAAKVDRERLATLKHYYNVLMQRCQRAEFAATQLDRTVKWL